MVVDASAEERNALPPLGSIAIDGPCRGRETAVVRTLMRTLAPLGATAAVLLALPPAAPADRASEALVLLGDVVHGRDSAVVARFDDRMRASLNEAGLEDAWARYEQLFGRYVDHGEPRSSALGPYTVVRVPLTMSRRDGEFRISFATDGKIAGLYFLRSGVPL